MSRKTVAQNVLLFLCCAGLNSAVGQYAPTDYEQYQLELINRARANPVAEVARLSGVTWGDTGSPRPPSLNEGLAAGTISTAAKPPLAFSPKLIKSARDYSNVCLSANGWGHNFGGTNPGSRMTAAGYAFAGSWSYAENIAWSGSTGTYPLTVPVVDYLYEILFVDGDVPGRGHRINLMDAGTKEIGIGLGTGANYKGGGSGTGYNAAFVTQDFAVSSGNSFLTGVVFKDKDGNDFYSPGEGIGGVTVTAVPTGGGSGQATSTWSSGGYTLQLAPGTYNVSAVGEFGTYNLGGISISSANIKLDARILAAWRSAQLTMSPNAADGNRTGAAHSSAHLYFYKGTDSNIWASFWNGGQWAQAPLTSDANVDDWLTFGTAYNLLCYKGKDNRLWVMYFNGSVWRASPLGTNDNVAGDVVMDSAWNLIYYRGTDGRVWTTWWTGSQWAQATLGGTANVLGSLSVDSRHHLVYYQGSGNEMWCYYWTGAAWVQSRMGATANVGGSVTADSGGGMAYYRSSADNTTWAVYWNGSAWAQTQLDSLAGMAASSPITAFSQTVALYLNASGQCCAQLWTGSRWGSGVLGDGGSGLTSGLSVQRSGNLIFARRSDGHVVIFYYQ